MGQSVRQGCTCWVAWCDPPAPPAPLLVTQRHGGCGWCYARAGDQGLACLPRKHVQPAPVACTNQRLLRLSLAAGWSPCPSPSRPTARFALPSTRHCPTTRPSPTMASHTRPQLPTLPTLMPSSPTPSSPTPHMGIPMPRLPPPLPTTSHRRQLGMGTHLTLSLRHMPPILTARPQRPRPRLWAHPLQATRLCAPAQLAHKQCSQPVCVHTAQQPLPVLSGGCSLRGLIAVCL